MAIYGGPIVTDLCIQMQPDGPLNWLYNLLPDLLQPVIDSIAADSSGATATGLLAGLLPDLMTTVIGIKPFLKMNIISHQSNYPDSLPLPPMINLQEGTFGFFKGTNATKSWWKINNGRYNMEQYQDVLEFNGNARYILHITVIKQCLDCIHL